MTERISRWRRDYWLPGLVGCIGALVALTGWGLLVADRRAHLLEATRADATETRQALEFVLGQQIATLRGLRDLWLEYGLRPEPEWAARANQQIDRVIGLASLAWIDLDEPLNRIAAGREQAAEKVDVDISKARVHFEEPHLAGPLRDDGDRFGFRVFLPVRADDTHAGVLVAYFEAEPLLRSALLARASGHAVMVYWDDHVIFSQGVPSGNPWQSWWRVEQAVVLPIGGGWRVVYRPTSELAAARLSAMPHYLLAAGLGLSLLLAVAVHQMRVIVRQSRFLSATNEALEQRGQDLESEVAQRTEALEDALAELEAFNYSVSHDLRSPLGAILNFATILEEDYRDEPLDEEGTQVLARIRRSAERATRLLEDLLELSRAGRAALDYERVDMVALARETFAQVRAAQPGDPEVEFRVDPLPEAWADETLIGGVLANLFSNALKYSRHREKRRIGVRGWVEGRECFYQVSDNGQGFDMRFVDKLYGLFERLHSDREVEGTGVGLALVSRIVKRHGGRVWAEGELGEGARFGFALPRGGAS